MDRRRSASIQKSTYSQRLVSRTLLAAHHSSTPLAMAWGESFVAFAENVCKDVVCVLHDVTAGGDVIVDVGDERDRMWPRTLPWITPASTLFHSVVTLPTFTRCVLLLRYASIHRQSQAGSSLSSFERRTSWSTR
jgi:hypothetical protein